MILEAVIWLSLIIFLLDMFFELFGPDGTRFEPEMLAPAGVAYLIYIIHLACCVRLTRAFANESRGIESVSSSDLPVQSPRMIFGTYSSNAQVMFLMDKPRYENPYYKWHVQCRELKNNLQPSDVEMSR